MSNRRNASGRQRRAPDAARAADIEKSRSLESDYDCYQCPNFDKSHSFDEDFADSVSCSYLDDNRSYSIDQMHAKGRQKSHSLRVHDPSRAASAQRLQHPHAAKHSPGYRSSNERNQESMPRTSGRHFDKSKCRNAIRDHSPSALSKVSAMHSSFGSNTSSGHEYDDSRAAYSDDYELRGTTVNDELIREAKLVSNFMYGSKAKADTLVNKRRIDSKSSARKNAASASATAAAAGRYNL